MCKLVREEEVVDFGVEDYRDSDEYRLSGWARFGSWVLVGHGAVTRLDRCGKFAGWRGCDRVDLHDVVHLDSGEAEFKGMAFARMKHKSCNRPGCPVCFLSWCQREARRASGKIGAFVNDGLGEFQHVVLSVPRGLWHLRSQVLISRCMKVAKNRGVLGGGLIFHAFRFADWFEARDKGVPYGWRFSPHFHVGGFVKDNGRCRSCNRSRVECASCPGFFGRVKRGFVKDGWVVKLEEKRKTVHGTFWYQLNHATIDEGVKRFSVLRWFGVCKKAPVSKVLEEVDVCPCCLNELRELRCLDGSVRGVDRQSYTKKFPRWFDYYDKVSGQPLWVVKERERYEAFE